MSMFGTGGQRGTWAAPPKRRRRWVPFAFMIGAAVIGGALLMFALTRPPQGEELQAACALVVDRTGSVTDQPGLQESLLHGAETTIDGCRDSQATLTIGSFSQAGSTLVLHNKEPYSLYQKPSHNPSEEAEELEARVAEAKALLAEATQTSGEEERRSDILAAIGVAAANLQSDRPGNEFDDRYLVVLTDGIQLAGEISVSALGEEEANVEPLVTRAEQLGLLPDLRGIDVSFVGVRSGETAEGEELPDWFEAKVEQFWTEVVAASGGQLCVYEPGPVLVLPGDC